MALFPAPEDPWIRQRPASSRLRSRCSVPRSVSPSGTTDPLARRVSARQPRGGAVHRSRIGSPGERPLPFDASGGDQPLLRGPRGREVRVGAAEPAGVSSMACVLPPVIDAPVLMRGWGMGTCGMRSSAVGEVRVNEGQVRVRGRVAIEQHVGTAALPCFAEDAKQVSWDVHDQVLRRVDEPAVAGAAAGELTAATMFDGSRSSLSANCASSQVQVSADRWPLDTSRKRRIIARSPRSRRSARRWSHRPAGRPAVRRASLRSPPTRWIGVCRGRAAARRRRTHPDAV